MANENEAEDVAIITTPLDGDERKFILKSMRGSEGLSKPFRFDLVLTAFDDAVPFDDLVSQSVTIALPIGGLDTRYFNGVVVDISQVWSAGDQEEGPGEALGTDYEVTVVPKLWLCSRIRRSRVFQGEKVPDIVKKVLADSGVESLQINLNPDDYLERDYCVQYGESDLDFVSRLLEDEGIYYHFEHTEDDHSVVLMDGSSLPTALQTSGELASLRRRRELRAARFEHRDYDFSEPNQELGASIESQISPAFGEHYEYLEGRREKFDEDVMIDRERLERRIRLRAEEEEAQALQYQGTSDCRGFAPGYLFSFDEKHGPADLAGTELLLLEVEHDLTQGKRYENRFRCMNGETPFRPPRVTPKPRVEGPQSAVVVGPEGEEGAHTDAHGRVKVKFHWDREAPGDHTSSCWIRVSQAWAGAGWGAIAIPHIGHEVIVDFLEGDPDRPVVMGRVYHEANRTPQLPADGGEANKYKSGIRDNFGNELAFDSTPGDEHIRLFSPHHQSGMNLGRSISMFSASDFKDATKGNKLAVVCGTKMNLTAGTAVSGVAGNDLSFKIGSSAGVTVGAKFDVVAGSTGSVHIGQKFESSKTKSSIATDGYNLISGATHVNILGGTKVAGDKMSILDMNAHEFVATVGENKNQPAVEAKHWKARGVAAAALLTSIVSSFAGSYLRQGAGLDEEMTAAEKEDRALLLGGAEATINTVTGVIAGIALAGAKPSADPQTHKDDNPDAMLRMTSNGKAGLVGTDFAFLAATEKIENHTTKPKFTTWLELQQKGKINLFTHFKEKKATHIALDRKTMTAKSNKVLVEALKSTIELKAKKEVKVKAKKFTANGNLVVTK